MTPLGRMLISTMLVLALGALVAGTATATDESETPPATTTLQGENLVAPFTGLTVTSNCNQLGNSTVSYHAEGVATGPYPGTFVADGTITIGPQTAPARPPTIDSEGTFMGPILTLDGDVHDPLRHDDDHRVETADCAGHGRAGASHLPEPHLLRRHNRVPAESSRSRQRPLPGDDQRAGGHFHRQRPRNSGSDPGRDHGLLSRRAVLQLEQRQLRPALHALGPGGSTPNL